MTMASLPTMELLHLLHTLINLLPVRTLSAMRENNIVRGRGAPIISCCRWWLLLSLKAIGWWPCSQWYVILADDTPPSMARNIAVAPLLSHIAVTYTTPPIIYRDGSAARLRTHDLGLACFLLLTTTPHIHLRPYQIFLILILFSNEFKLIVRGPKWIQIKKLSTTKLYNSSRSTTFILVVSPSEAV
jgi:hypothetical protein